MVEQQIRPWDVLDQRVLEVCGSVHREHFVPDAYRRLAFSDTCIDIGHGESMMAPKVEARLLQAVDVREADRVLEIGTGSGYLAALLASLGKHVTSIEYHADLAEHAKARLRRAGLAHKVQVHVGDGIDGWRTAEPYDVIVLTGSSPQRRHTIEQQLAIGGRLFIVVGSAPVMEALLVVRHGADSFSAESLFETELKPLIGAEPKPAFRF